MPYLVDEQELMDRFGYTRRADLERCLRDQKVRVFYGKGGRITTTPRALDAAILGEKLDAETIDFANSP